MAAVCLWNLSYITVNGCCSVILHRDCITHCENAWAVNSPISAHLVFFPLVPGKQWHLEAILRINDKHNWMLNCKEIQSAQFTTSE